MIAVQLPSGAIVGYFATKDEALSMMKSQKLEGARAVYVASLPERKSVMMHTITVKNHSSLPEGDVVQMVRAVRTQLADQFCPAHGLRTPEVQYAPPKVTPATGPGRAVLILVDTDTTDPEALGYHTEENDGTIYAVIVVGAVLDAGGVSLIDKTDLTKLTVSSVVSHEILEMTLNPYVNLYADSAGGQSWSREACDPVEADQYRMTGAQVPFDCMVSNFVLPSFFDSNAATKCDWLGNVTTPFTLGSGGYAVVRDGGPGTEREIFGDVVPDGSGSYKACLPWRKTKRIVGGRSIQLLKENYIEPPDPVIEAELVDPAHDLDEVLRNTELPLADVELASLKDVPTDPEPVTKVDIKKAEPEKPETD